MEEVTFSIDLLEQPNEDGVSILFYLQKIFPGPFSFSLFFLLISCSISNWYSILLNSCNTDEWTNFLERMNCTSEEQLRTSLALEEQLCLWASYRGQTLTKTGINSLYLSINQSMRVCVCICLVCHIDFLFVAMNSSYICFVYLRQLSTFKD